MENPRTITTTEYALYGLTAQGKWRLITCANLRTAGAAVKALEEHKRLCEAYPSVYKRSKDYKIMKRVVVTTLGEWEEVDG